MQGPKNTLLQRTFYDYLWGGVDCLIKKLGFLVAAFG